MKRAVTYSRNSVDKGKRSATIDDQKRMCREYAEGLGFEVVREFDDPNLSGVAIGNRPGFRAMMRAAESREFDELIMMDMTRFSRSAGDCNQQLDMLQHYKIRVHDASKEICSDDDSFRTLIDVDNLTSRIVVKGASKKSWYNHRNKSERGEVTGGAPYGYRIVEVVGKKTLEIVPEEATVVRRIYAEYAAGVGAKLIVYGLNDDGIPSPGARWDRSARITFGKWHPATVLGDRKKGTGLLQNELYAGRSVWNRSRFIKHPVTGLRHREMLPPSQWVRRDVPELRIVDDLVWQRVRARQVALDVNVRSVGVAHGANQVRAARREPTFYLFSTLLRCGVCGANFTMAEVSLLAENQLRQGVVYKSPAGAAHHTRITAARFAASRTHPRRLLESVVVGTRAERPSRGCRAGR